MSKVDSKVSVLADSLETEALENIKETNPAATHNVMNIYEKIQKAKMMLTEANLKKSGINKFSNFQYYELADFMPSVIMTFNELKLFSKVTFTDEMATLKIINAENPTEIEEYTSPMKTLELKGANAMQSLGGVETYQRRYLYMSALDITESDMFDAGNGNGTNGGNGNNSCNGNAKNENVSSVTNNKASEQTAAAKNDNNNSVPNVKAPEQPQVGGKKASEAQVKMIHGIINDIAKGYSAIGQSAPPEAIIKRMRETLQIDKEMSDFLIADASKAIDYLTDIKVKIPKQSA